MTDALTRPLEWAPAKQAISRVPYLPGLDGMRAVAVVAVMIYHANNSWLPGGFLGVEVFFVISGYLITLLLIGEHEKTGRVNLGQFWLRRARRLLPALFVLLVGLTIYTTFFRQDVLGQLRGDVIAGLAYGSNWYQIWVGQGYTASGDFAPLRHLWSLAVEEQFYLIWPLVMVGLMRLGRRRLPEIARWVFLGSVVIAVGTALLYHHGPIEGCTVTPQAYWQLGGRCISKADALYLSTLTRASGVLLGGAFAMVWRPMALRRGPIREKGPLVDLVALCGFLGLAAMTWMVHVVTPEGADPWLFRGGFFLTGLATVAMIAAVTHPAAIAGKVLGIPILLWIGSRSYGLYLFHWPVYQAIRRIAGVPLSFGQFVLAMVITVPITEMSYRFVETPIRTGRIAAWWRRLRRQRDPAPRRVIAGIAAGVAALSMFAFANLATAELKQNEIAQSLDQGQAVVVDLGQLATSTTLDPAAGSSDGADEPAAAGSSTLASNVDPPTPGASTPAAAPDPAAATTVAAVPATTVASPPPLGKIAVGDSVMLGAAASLEAAGYTVDAEQNRQMNSYIPTLEGLRDTGQLAGVGVAVVHLGTNGNFSDETAARFFGALSSVPRVIVMTIRADRGWTVPNNAKLYNLPGQYPNVQILDWGQLSNSCPGDCYYDDGIHLKPDGQAYYTQLVNEAVG